MSNTEEEWVQIMDRERPEPAPHLRLLYDEESRTYSSPGRPGQFGKSQENHMGWSPAAAFLDTGLLRNHPYIRNRIEAEIDFTGEGPEDRNGHGSLVTLIHIASSAESKIINVKVMDKTGRGKEEWLIDGLNWLSDYAIRNRRMIFANISAGIYHKRLGIMKCDGKCRLVQAAKRAEKEAHILMHFAAGNNGPTEIPCPQRGALIGEFAAVIVAQLDPITQKPKPHSGPGNFGIAVMTPDWHVC